MYSDACRVGDLPGLALGVSGVPGLEYPESISVTVGFNREDPAEYGSRSRSRRREDDDPSAAEGIVVDRGNDGGSGRTSRVDCIVADRCAVGVPRTDADGMRMFAGDEAECTILGTVPRDDDRGSYSGVAGSTISMWSRVDSRREGRDRLEPR